MRIDDRLLRPAANNLTLVRLLLAASVIYTHCYWLLSGRMGEDDLSALLGAPVSAYAVDGFFFLSGFLVYASLGRSRGVGGFLLARLVRLWPALALSVGLTVAVGYVLTIDREGYFAGATARFVRNNLSFVAPAYHLTGVLCDGRPCTMNGSLWTLPWEARCYLTLAALALLGASGEKAMARLVLPVTLVAAIAWHLPGMREAAGTWTGRDALYYPDMADRLWPLFALGAAAYVFRDRIYLSWPLLGLLFLLNIAAHHWGIGLHVRALFVGYLVLCLGLLTARRGAVSGGWPDYSYGMYIYAFPVMIALGAWRDWSSHFALALATAAATLPLAAFSWHCVEKPALDRFRRYRKRRAPAAPPVGAVA